LDRETTQYPTSVWEAAELGEPFLKHIQSLSILYRKGWVGLDIYIA
jgi:hypothetical protein